MHPLVPFAFALAFLFPFASPAAAEDGGLAGTGRACVVELGGLGANCADAVLEGTLLACNVPHEGGYACRIEWTLTVKTTGVDVCGKATATTGNEVHPFCGDVGGHSKNVVTKYYQQSPSATLEYTEEGTVSVAPSELRWTSAPIETIRFAIPPAVEPSGFSATSPAPLADESVEAVNGLVAEGGTVGDELLRVYDETLLSVATLPLHLA